MLLGYFMFKVCLLCNCYNGIFRNKYDNFMAVMNSIIKNNKADISSCWMRGSINQILEHFDYVYLRSGNFSNWIKFFLKLVCKPIRNLNLFCLFAVPIHYIGV